MEGPLARIRRGDPSPVLPKIEKLKLSKISVESKSRKEKPPKAPDGPVISPDMDTPRPEERFEQAKWRAEQMARKLLKVPADLLYVEVEKTEAEKALRPRNPELLKKTAEVCAQIGFENTIDTVRAHRAFNIAFKHYTWLVCAFKKPDQITVLADFVAHVRSRLFPDAQS